MERVDKEYKGRDGTEREVNREIIRGGEVKTWIMQS